MRGHAPLDELTKCLARLPGVGRRSAERMALAMVRDGGTLSSALVAAIQNVKQRLCNCSCCGSVTARDEDPCQLCTSTTRDESLLCIVEEPSDIIMLEKSGGYQGRYHALMGRLSPMKGQGPSDIRVKALMKRLESEAIREVILALSTDVEGDATASYLTDLLKDRGVRVTRLAFGLPAGSGIAYSDGVTLARALRGRGQV